MGYESRDWDLSVQVQIWALRSKFEYQSWDLSYEAEIWALRAEGGGAEKEEKEKEEKIPQTVEHR